MLLARNRVQMISLWAILAMALVTFTPAKAAPVKISLWHTAIPEDPFRTALQQAVDRYNAAHPDIQFEVNATDPAGLKSKLQNPPDVFQIGDGAVLRDLAQQNLIREVPGL